MTQPFIRNHQFNLIKKQTRLLHHACSTVSDPKVVDSVRASVQSRIAETFSDSASLQTLTIEKLSTLKTAEDFQNYLISLEPYLEAFEPVTDKQLRKLFPKIKKLTVPDLTEIDFRYVTYLGWTDIATNKLFIVYRRNGRLVGIEGRFTPANKKSTCFICNRVEDVALFSAITKSRPANASPDYYKAIGNYMCVDSSVCNTNMTDVAALEKFVIAVAGE